MLVVLEALELSLMDRTSDTTNPFEAGFLLLAKTGNNSVIGMEPVAGVVAFSTVELALSLAQAAVSSSPPEMSPASEVALPLVILSAKAMIASEGSTGSDASAPQEASAASKDSNGFEGSKSPDPVVSSVISSTDWLTASGLAEPLVAFLRRR